MKSPMKTLLLAAIASSAATNAFAASHSDAPLIVQDPVANISDVYAFVTGTGSNKKLNLIMNVIPLEDPANGVIYYHFGDDVLYQLHIVKQTRNRNGTWNYANSDAIRYDFRFRSSYKNPNTILSYGLGTEAGPIQSVGDNRMNRTQFFTVEKVVGVSRIGQNLQDMAVPPCNVGPRTTPNYYDGNGNLLTGAMSANELDSYTAESIFAIKDGSRVFAGQRDDAFFADTGGIFDFLGVRNPGRDSFSGLNVHSICMQIPLSSIVREGDSPLIGVYGTTARQKTRILTTTDNQDSGQWVQVGRMGNPLFNETLVSLGAKDLYNRTTPFKDAQLFKQYAQTSELAFLLNAVLGTNLQVNNRTDLVGFFIPDYLRLDTSMDAPPLAGQQGFNRLSVFGGDTRTSAFTGEQVASGWPNGRRIGDDVVDIALTAVASGPSYSNIVSVSDNVSSNDFPYPTVFPYIGTPQGGATSSLHP